MHGDCRDIDKHRTNTRVQDRRRASFVTVNKPKKIANNNQRKHNSRDIFWRLCFDYFNKLRDAGACRKNCCKKPKIFDHQSLTLIAMSGQLFSQILHWMQSLILHLTDGWLKWPRIFSSQDRHFLGQSSIHKPQDLHWSGNCDHFLPFSSYTFGIFVINIPSP